MLADVAWLQQGRTVSVEGGGSDSASERRSNACMLTFWRREVALLQPCFGDCPMLHVPAGVMSECPE